jgi:hypothetical protein
MVSPIIAQGTLGAVATWTRPDGTSIPHVCGGSTNSFVQAYLYAVEKMQGPTSPSAPTSTVLPAFQARRQVPTHALVAALIPTSTSQDWHTPSSLPAE